MIVTNCANHTPWTPAMVEGFKLIETHLSLWRERIVRLYEHPTEPDKVVSFGIPVNIFSEQFEPLLGNGNTIPASKLDEVTSKRFDRAMVIAIEARREWEFEINNANIVGPQFTWVSR